MAEIDTAAERERIEQWRRDEAFFSTCEAARLYLSEIDRLRGENAELREQLEAQHWNSLSDAEKDEAIRKAGQ